MRPGCEKVLENGIRLLALVGDGAVAEDAAEGARQELRERLLLRALRRGERAGEQHRRALVPSHSCPCGSVVRALSRGSDACTPVRSPRGLEFEQIRVG